MKLLSLFLLCMSTLSGSISLTLMDEATKKSCGIEKLSLDEKKALEAWLAESSQEPSSGSTVDHGEFKIAEIQDLGHFVVLENGVSYDIYSRSRRKTMGWKVGEIVKLAEPIKRRSFKLTNRSKKQTVAAKS